MNFKDIENILNEEKQVVYHAGTLGGKSDKFFTMDSSPRSTGYFGTGYYFVTNLRNIENFSKNKTVYSFDISGLKLARGTIKLHNALKHLTFIMQDYENIKPLLKNYGYINPPDNLSIYSRNALGNFTKDKLELSELGFSPSKFESILDNLYKQYLKADRNGDSISTIFMKSLGYQGVYPAPECDNTEFGGVIYEKNNMKEIQLVNK